MKFFHWKKSTLKYKRIIFMIIFGINSYFKNMQLAPLHTARRSLPRYQALLPPEERAWQRVFVPHNYHPRRSMHTSLSATSGARFSSIATMAPSTLSLRQRMWIG